METFKGFVFSKHILVGTKNEGEAYFLQTFRKDYHIISSYDAPFIPDKKLAAFVRKIVEIEGELIVKEAKHNEPFPSLEVIYVHKIKDINTGIIPRE
jgi:hypothetical protein